MYLIFLSTIICQLVDQHCTAREPTAKIESDLCEKNEDRALATNSLFNLGNLGSYIFACFRCVTFKLGKFMNVNIKVLFLVVLMDFCQMDLVC